ncbi:MAG: hypothetical protein ACK6AD_03150 [Cyanobacteriota bacterium]
MTLAFQSLLMMVLLVTGTVAVVPFVLRESRPLPSPTLRAGLGPAALWLVESAQGKWSLNGTPHTPQELERLLPTRARSRLVHYLPSDALPLARVSRSLRWLRDLAPASVVLELPPGSRPSR